MMVPNPQHTSSKGKMKLTLKEQISTVADDSLEYVFIVFLIN